jgi:hypothetical protein
MVTTWRARRCRFDVLSGDSYLEKGSGFRVLGRFWASRWVNHSPVIAHFIALKPHGVYRAQCESLREWARQHGNPATARVPIPET